MCRRGDSYSPSIVRVGLSVHHSVMSVAMDTLINKRMQSEKAGLSSSCDALIPQASPGHTNHR